MTMINPVEETHKVLINKWGKEYKGKGCIHCVRPLDYKEIIINIITLMRNKNPDISIFIVVSEWRYREDLFKEFDNRNINKFGISCITTNYVNNKYKYIYDLIISIGINEWDHNADIIFFRCKFKLMILTDNNISSNKLSEIYKNIPCVNDIINSENINSYRLSTPVEEHRIPILFNSDEDKTNYLKYDDYVYQTITIFGNFDSVHAARSGTKDGKSAAQFRDEIATYNGWSAEMDMTSPFNKKIDDCYNPNILLERANTCFDIIRKRAIMCTDNEAKLDKIVEIIKDNPNKTFMVISKRGEFAVTVTEYINDKLGDICGDYHDKIDNRMLTDANGIPILYKSGAKKNTPRIIGATAISSLNMKAFNEGQLRVLSIKNASSDSLQINVDEWIFTSPLCDTVDQLRYRFKNVVCNNKVLKVYKLYMDGTIEQKAVISKEKESPTYTIIENNVNYLFAGKNNEENIC